MIPKSILEYINLGGRLSYLRSAKENFIAQGDTKVLGNIKKFINSIENSEFKVTRNALSELIEYKETLEKTDKNYRISKAEASRLFFIMDRIWVVLRAETKNFFTFSISEKRIDSSKLIFNIELLLAKDVFNSLPDSIQYDFSEGGKCIAFECATASAFHVLRGVEGLLRLLLKKLSPTVDVSKMPWGDVVKELRNLNVADLGVLLDNCDRIRYNYRNPTDHPEKIYDIDKAQDLFSLCVGVVNDIVAYMKTNNLL